MISGKESILFFAILLLSAAVLVGGEGRQQETTPLHVPKVDGEITVDGNLHDSVWQEALRIELPYEVRPGENTPAPVKTEVFIAYSESTLFVAFKAHDPNPDEIRAQLNDRDSGFDGDWVGIILDTFNDEKRSLDFICNPLGVQADFIESSNGEDMGWDAIWQSAGKIHEWGYAVEMAIPFSSFSFQKTQGEQTWGIDAVRNYPRTLNHFIGAFPRDRNNACYLCQAIKITGFEGVDAGTNVELTPTITSLHSQNRPEMPFGEFQTDRRETEVGITGSWGITNNINLGATINPDFSQVEADAAQLNINRAHALYYRERRPFFMEQADFFSDLIYTRSMADPVWGSRVTGKQGNHTFAGVVVEDDITNILIPGNTGSSIATLSQNNTAAAGRYNYEYGQRSTVGLLFTDREGDEYYNRVVSVDGRHWLTGHDFIQYQAAGSDTRYPGEVAEAYEQEGDSFSGHGLNLMYFHTKRDYNVFAVYRRISDGYRNDMGFTTAADWVLYLAGGRYFFYPDGSTWWSKVTLEAEIQAIEDQDGKKLHNYNVLSASFSGAYNTFLLAEASLGKQYYAGQYFDHNDYTFVTRVSPHADFDLGCVTTFGDYLDYAHVRPGSRVNINPYGELRIARNINVAGGFEYERMVIDEGELYTASILEIKVKYQFSNRSFLRGHIKYYSYDYNPDLYRWDQHTESQDLFTQLLFSYKINPRTVFFLGYTDNYEGNQHYTVTQTNRTLFTKIGYSWNP